MDKQEILNIIQRALLPARLCESISNLIRVETLFYYVWDNDLKSSTDIILSNEVEQWQIDHPNCKSRKLVPAFMLHDVISH